jgi:hypothetical protein
MASLAAIGGADNRGLRRRRKRIFGAGMRRRGLARAALAVVGLGIAAAATAPSAAAADTVWLCKPGTQPNPCHESLATTVYSPQGDSHVENPANARRPKIDCFYVYPTVSEQMGTNSDRTVEPQQKAIAEYQAARFSQRCRVFAPMYRQLTLAAIAAPPSKEEFVAAARLAYRDVRDAWLDYLRHYNKGRGFVLIGHSQGAGMLTALVRKQIDPFPALRGRLVSAILLGGNVVTKRGKRVGGSFDHIPTCASRSEIGCLIAFSTFNETPPDNTRFGRSASRFADPLGLPNGPGFEVVCTNPASLAGGRAPLQSLLRSEPFPGVIGALLLIMYGGPPPSAPTPWLQPQDHYTGRCVHENKAHVLMVYPIATARKLNPSPDDTWGLHLADVNIGLGNLVEIVKHETRTYLEEPGRRASRRGG